MTTDLAVIQAELDGPNRDAKRALELLRTFPVDSSERLDLAAHLTKEVKAQRVYLDGRRKELVGPLKEVTSAIDTAFRPVLRYLDEQEQILKAKMADYSMAQMQAQRDLMKASAEEHAAGGSPTAIIPPTPQVEGLSVKETWAFEVTDPDLVPAQFCSPDPAKIQASRDWVMYSAGHPPPPIPGVRFFLKGQVRISK